MNPTLDNTIDYDKYLEFVNTTTSFPSKDTDEFVNRVKDLQEKGVPIERLLTAAVGITAEGGEFTEIVKKVAFQGKELSPDVKTHLIKELGDVFWYIAQACLALEVDFQTVVVTNMIKLAARYPEGTFDIFRSENRKEGDI
jgi:NTP pyrophosphatase (non-canonical NTP hydrolase)